MKDHDSNTTKVQRRELLAYLGTASAMGFLPVGLGGDEAFAQNPAPKVLTTMITPEPPIAVLGVNNQGPTQIVGSKIFEGLLTFSKSLEPRPGLAKAWNVSSDGLTYTFTLNSGVTWHDGKPFSADDVIFSLMTFHMDVSPRSRAILQRIESAAAPDPATVVLKLKQPFEPFLLMFDVTSCAIVPKHIYDGTDFRQNPANLKPVGTGPFKLEEWQRGNFIRLVKNNTYWKPGHPKLDGIIYRVIPDSNLRGVALQTGQVQLSAQNDIEPFDVPKLRENPNFTVATDGWEYFAPVSYLEINNRVKHLNDPRVRRALAMAIDRSFIVKNLWFGVGKAATSPIASVTRFHDASVKMPAFDPAAAAKLLDEAGLKPGADGTRLEVKFLPIPYGEIWLRLGEYIRQSLGRVGIKLVTESVDAATWAKRVANWEYELTVNISNQWGDPTLGVERLYVSTNIQKVFATNTMGYVNSKVDDLFKQGREAQSADVRARAFSEVQKVLVEEMPVVWLTEMSYPTIYDRRLKNVITGATGVFSTFDAVEFGSP